VEYLRVSDFLFLVFASMTFQVFILGPFILHLTSFCQALLFVFLV